MHGLGWIKILKILTLSLLISRFFLDFSTVSAQSIGENIRPIGQVCLIGQSCVGAKAVLLTNETISDIGNPVESPEERTAAVDQGNGTISESLGDEDNDFDVMAAYQTSCFACHASGAAGAPILGDLEAWESRMEKGIETVMANVINGMNAMPARGLCMDCSDNQLQAIVDYMISQ